MEFENNFVIAFQISGGLPSRALVLPFDMILESLFWVLPAVQDSFKFSFRNDFIGAIIPF